MHCIYHTWPCLTLRLISCACFISCSIRFRLFFSFGEFSVQTWVKLHGQDTQIWLALRIANTVCNLSSYSSILKLNSFLQTRHFWLIIKRRRKSLKLIDNPLIFGVNLKRSDLSKQNYNILTRVFLWRKSFCFITVPGKAIASKLVHMGSWKVAKKLQTCSSSTTVECTTINFA